MLERQMRVFMGGRQGALFVDLTYNDKVAIPTLGVVSVSGVVEAVGLVFFFGTKDQHRDWCRTVRCDPRNLDKESAHPFELAEHLARVTLACR